MNDKAPDGELVELRSPEPVLVSTLRRPTRDAFIAFEGGGAKGLAHVGALHALERVSENLSSEGKEMHVVGVAGTSAGAIVAALYAAGFSAADLVDPANKKHLLNRKEVEGLECERTTDLVGRKNWRSIANLRLVSKFGSWVAAALVIGIAAAIGFGVKGQSPLWAGVTAFVLTYWVFRYLYKVSLGLADVGHVRKSMDHVLKARIKGADSEERVRFRDFGGSTGRPSLKIVATDITNRRMVLFSPETTPCMPVAEAVAASICIPLVFKPWKIEDLNAEFLDGGLVSNLPAWPFDEERLLNPKALTLAFEIVEPKKEPKSGGALSKVGAWCWRKLRGSREHWLAPALNTAVFGANQLNKRASGEIEVLELNIDLSLLDFDASEEKIFAQVSDVAKYSEANLRSALITIPALMQEAADQIQDSVEKILKPLIPLIPPEAIPGRPRVRVAMMVQDQSAHRSYQAKFCAGYIASDPDISIILPAEGSYVGAAQVRKGAMFTHVVPGAGPTAYGRFANASELARMESLAWPGMRWSCCIPIDKAHLPKRWKHLVVAIDGNHDFLGVGQNVIDIVMKSILKSTEAAMVRSLKLIAN